MEEIFAKDPSTPDDLEAMKVAVIKWRQLESTITTPQEALDQAEKLGVESVPVSATSQ